MVIMFCHCYDLLLKTKLKFLHSINLSCFETFKLTEAVVTFKSHSSTRNSYFPTHKGLFLK